MKREWKPGAIAAVNGRVCMLLADGMTWEHGDPRAFAFVNDPGLDIRPLVVIDPENLDDVKRLGALAFGTPFPDAAFDEVGDLQDALREFADPKPPKPEEPTGLGAVVEAINDNRFIRVGEAGWVHEQDTCGIPCDWDDIAVIRVLNEGWSE